MEIRNNNRNLVFCLPGSGSLGSHGRGQAGGAFCPCEVATGQGSPVREQQGWARVKVRTRVSRGQPEQTMLCCALGTLFILLRSFH